MGHVAAYMGVVEPQMRKALHMHMLVQLLGFAHPDDIFKAGRFHETFKRVWRYVSSVSYRSTEAFASQCNAPEAFHALQTAPLMPITKISVV